MDGAFRSDISRDTFDYLKHFSRVIKQQGRVDLDAEWNEQVDILLYYLRTLATDLIGPRVADGSGFLITPTADGSGHHAESTLSATPASAKTRMDTRETTNNKALELYLQTGHYYIDGLLLENEGGICDPQKVDGSVTGACPYQLSVQKGDDVVALLFYLIAWERQVTYIEDNGIREVALGVLGPDTTTRGKVVWQVHAAVETPGGDPLPDLTDKTTLDNFDKENGGWDQQWVQTLQPPAPFRGQLKARTLENSIKNTDPCVIPPDAKYRGTENQLYRVEIHDGGAAGSATFKWSRENASVIYPIVGGISGNVIKLEHLGRDERFSLQKDDWVEIVDDATLPVDTLPPSEPPPPLLQIDHVDYIHSQIILKQAPENIVQGFTHPILRRWEYYQEDSRNNGTGSPSTGTTAIVEDNWFTLEDGIQILFQSKGQPRKQAHDQEINYRPGDYWLIPARIVTGTIEWPYNEQTHQPLAVAPHGVEHHYAPLAYITFNSNGRVDKIVDLRRTMSKIYTGPAGLVVMAMEEKELVSPSGKTEPS